MPDKSELMLWYKSRTTQWVMKRLEEKFRPVPPHCGFKDWDDHNLRVGEQRVIYEIKVICDVDNIPPSKATNS